LHITCAPAESPGRAFQLQAIDQAEIAAPLCRRVIRIEHASEVQAAIAGACGPVLVQVAKTVWRENASDPGAPAPRVQALDHDGDAMAAATALDAASRTVLLLGQGCHGASDLSIELADRLKAAVFTTTSGRGSIPEDHPRSLAFDSGNGAGTFNALIETSDLVLAIGCKFSHNGA